MTSNPGEGVVEKVAADANVLLSAIAGKAALKVFMKASVEVVTTTSILAEVHKYLPEIARACRLAPEVLEGQLRLLTLKPYDQRDYQPWVGEATKRIGRRDPKDVDLLALALALELPVWSNDNDFDGTGVDWYTTAELLRELRIR